MASQHNSDIGFIHWEKMTIQTDPELPLVASKLYPLHLKHYRTKSKIY